VIEVAKLNKTKQGKPLAHEFVEQLREELVSQAGGWRRLERMSAGQLSHAWLVSFANEKIKQPSVDKAMILAQFLGVKVRFASGQHFNLFGG
jgi:hypothetical protein